MKKRIVHSTIALTMIVSLLFTACVKEENNEFPDVTATNDTIYGTLKYKQPQSTGGIIVAWPYGAATFKVIADSSEVIASAPVNADGTFTVVLPGTMSGSFLSSLAHIAQSQGGTVAAAPNTTRFLSALQYKVEYSFDGNSEVISTNLYTLKSDNSIEKSYFYNFYDSDGTFAGTSYVGNIFNWTFAKGWGMVESNTTNSTTYTFNSNSISVLPPAAVWVNL